MHAVMNYSLDFKNGVEYHKHEDGTDNGDYIKWDICIDHCNCDIGGQIYWYC